MNFFQDTFQKPAVIDQPAELPSDLSGYDLSPELLGKGCNASIYSARVHESQQTSNNSLNLSISDLDSFEIVHMETESNTSETDDDDSEASFVVLEHGEKDCGSDVPLQPESEKSFDLAIKVGISFPFHLHIRLA